MYKLTFYVPATHLESVKTALFGAGAGRYANYDCCSWEVAGQGQFRPLDGSRPFLGTTGRIEKVAEYRVEMIVRDKVATEAITALKKAHPYEEPAYDLVRMVTQPEP